MGQISKQHLGENSQAQVDTLVSRIHELERLTDLLSRGKYLWESTFDAIQDPVSIIDAEFRVQRANLALAARAKMDIRNVIGQRCYEVFAKRNAPCEGCPAAEALRKDWQMKASLGHPLAGRDYEVLAYPFPGSKERGHAMVMHYRDVTEEKRLQQEVVQQEKMAAIGMLAGGVAHEINNPLGGILAFTQLLMREFQPGHTVRTDLEEIERAALRCKKIVQDLLDFSRSSPAEAKGAVSLGGMIEKVLGFVKREFLSQNIQVRIELAQTLPHVCGNANRLQQVMLNLLTNAVHAMPRGGIITIRGAHDAERNWVLLDIEDNGVGIKPDHLPKLFDPFFTTKKPGMGTGLGLSISYRIIRDHNGTMTVESREGAGTRFRIGLPCADQ